MSVGLLAAVALGAALLGLGAAGTVALRLWRAGRRDRPFVVPRAATAADAPPVLLIRPCAGDEPDLEERLTSVAGARHAFPLEVRVAVADADDPAHRPAEAACARLQALGWDARVVTTGARGANRKVAQLAAVLERSTAALVLWADSDVDLTGTDLDALVAPLLDSSSAAVGAVWAPPVERGPAETLGDRASHAILGGSLHAFPLLCHLDPAGMVGKLVAARATALRAVRFVDLGDVLGEDMELARRLSAAGLAVRVAPILAVARPRGRSLGAVVARFARWIAMIRAQRPSRLAGYPLLFAATPLVLLLAAAGAARAPVLAALAAGLALGTRLAVATLAARAAGRPAGLPARIVDVVLADAVLLAAFTRALGSRRLSWRGRSLRLGRGGRLEEPRTEVA